jgi:hypothetical protein
VDEVIAALMQARSLVKVLPNAQQFNPADAKYRRFTARSRNAGCRFESRGI